MPYPVAAVRGKNFGLISYSAKVLSYSPIAYWPLWETSGTVAECLVNSAQNGTYSSDVSGWPVGTGIGDGNTAPGFDGSNDSVDIFSTTLRDAFDKDEGSLAAWCKVSAAGIWEDAAFHFAVTLGKDGTDFYSLNKQNTNNTLRWIMGTETAAYRTVTKGSLSTTGWFHMAMTWTKVGTDLIGYYNGTSAGNDTNFAGTWGEVLTDGGVKIGAFAAAANKWSGTLAHVAVWDTPLTVPRIAILAAV